MTFLTNPSLVVKKTPLIAGKCNEEVIQMQQPGQVWRTSRRTINAFFWTAAITFLVTMVGITMGLMLYRFYIQATFLTRYTRFCTIPINMRYHAMPVMPVRWSSVPEPEVEAEAETQVLSAAPEDLSDEAVSTLREEFDIGDSVEKISVVNNGRQVSFIHDFDANLTGIVDADRCFTMELDPTVVLSPEVLVLSIVRGSPFDVSRVRTALRATLPTRAGAGADRATLPLRMPRDLIDHCRDKPTYELMKEDSIVIRKRSVDLPPHDYISFSGRHVQEIDISNLAELLQYEQDVQQSQLSQQ